MDNSTLEISEPGLPGHFSFEPSLHFIFESHQSSWPVTSQKFWVARVREGIRSIVCKRNAQKREKLTFPPRLSLLKSMQMW